MDMTSTTIGQLLLFCTTVLGFGIQIYREKRNRQWDLEDRERARVVLAKTAEIVAVETDMKQQKVIQKIEENTELSRGAFKEANDVNQKLLTMQSMINAAFDRRAESSRRRHVDPDLVAIETKELALETKELAIETKEVVVATHDKVENIEKKFL